MTRNQEMNIHFYMAEAEYYTDDNGKKKMRVKPNTNAVDLEATYVGLTYSSADGLLAKGKIKNLYTETYADSDILRVHYPSEIAREATTVKFVFYIVGDNRQAVYDSFYTYITGGLRAYWDDKRNKGIYFVAKNEYHPSEEIWVGGTPYLKLEIEVQNLFGETFDVA